MAPTRRRLAPRQTPASAYEAHLLLTRLEPQVKEASTLAHVAFAAAVADLARGLNSMAAAAFLLRRYADTLESFHQRDAEMHAGLDRRRRGRPKGSRDYDTDSLRARIQEIDAAAETYLKPIIRALGANNNTALARLILQEPQKLADVWRSSAKAGRPGVSLPALVRAIRRERLAMQADKHRTSGRGHPHEMGLRGQKIGHRR